MKKLLALLFAVLLGSSLTGCAKDNESVSLVSMDVNPGIQLALNKNDVVVDAFATNKDGEIILDDMDLEKTKVDVAVNAIVGSYVKNGYLSKEDNALLLTVENKDAQERKRLENYLNDQISTLLNAYEIKPAVLSLDLDVDDALEKMINKYDISAGKAELIEDIAESNSKYKVEDLVKLSVKDLILLEQQTEKSEKTNLSGEVNTSDYITKEEALSIALKDAGLSKSDIRDLEIDLDYDRSYLTYEIDFESGNYEYEYEINAVNKKIVREIENETKKTSSTSKPSSSSTNKVSYITKEEALNIALKDAGLSKNDVRDLEVEFDKDDGVAVYEISFETSKAEYEYEVNAVNKKITKEVENEIKKTTSKPSSSSTNKVTYITKDAALAVALKDAGLAKSDVVDIEVEFDKDDGKAVYEVSFEKGNRDYEYEIDALTKKIIKRD